MAPLRNVDALLLACTHYPAIRSDIQAELRSGVRLLDPAEALIEETLKRFALENQAGSDRFVTTGSAADMRRAAKRTA